MATEVDIAGGEKEGARGEGGGRGREKKVATAQGPKRGRERRGYPAKCT